MLPQTLHTFFYRMTSLPRRARETRCVCEYVCVRKPFCLYPLSDLAAFALT